MDESDVDPQEFKEYTRTFQISKQPWTRIKSFKFSTDSLYIYTLLETEKKTNLYYRKLLHIQNRNYR